MKGSVLRDYTASVECRLGADSNKSRGIAFFDNVTVEEISPADYNSYNANGNLTVDFDTQAPLDSSAATVSFPDTGITNGEFYQVGEYEYNAEEFRYPVVPASWTQYTPDTAGTQGYSTTAVETDSIIAGIVPTDNATFSACAAQGWLGNGAQNHVHKDGSILMLSSSEPTAFAYRSSAFTAAADTPGTLTVSLLAENMSATDYGASLVLKDGDRIISTIEGIKNTNGFKTYTFYIEPSSAEIGTLSIEIWLGNSDRKNNKSKLSAGYVYVQKVSYAAIEDDTTDDGAGNSTVTKSKAAKFAEFKTACDNERKAGLFVRAAYSFKSVDLTAYDVYDDSFIKYPYDWTLTASGENAGTVQYGVFDPNDRPASSYPFVPESFANSPQSTADGILLLNNKLPAASTLTYNGSLSLAADTYYRVEVSVRVDFPEQERANAKGATIALLDSNGNRKSVHADIRDTATKPDSIVTDTFRTYAFYIKSGSEATTVSLALSLGENDYSKQTAGRVYVNAVTCTDVNNTIYDQAVEEIGKRDKGKTYDETFRYARIADLSVADEEETDDTPSEKGCGTLDWWLIPSILFAVAILIALIGFMVRKIVEKKASKKGVVEKRVSYDRAATLNVEHNKNAADGEKVNSVAQDGNDTQYATFNDDETETAPQAATKAETADAESAVTENADTETAESAESTNESAETKPAQSGETDRKTDETAATDNAEDATQSDSPAPQTEFIDRFDD